MPFGCSSRAMAWAKPHGNLAHGEVRRLGVALDAGRGGRERKSRPMPPGGRMPLAASAPPEAHRRPTPRSTLHLERVAIEQGTAAVAGAGSRAGARRARALVVKRADAPWRAPPAAGRGQPRYRPA